MSEFGDEGWERDDTVRRTIVLPSDLAERLAAEAGRRGISLSDLLAEYAGQGLRHARDNKPAGPEGPMAGSG